MARVFVTGGTGFIGTELVRRLTEQGDQVTCLVRPSSSKVRAERLAKLHDSGVQLCSGDIRDPDSIAPAVASADVVFNVGGVTLALRDQEFLAGNRDGVRNLLDAAARRTSPPVVVHVSSLAAAGVSPRGAPRDENVSCTPVSNYGRSKRAGELVARQFADRVPITVIRPPMVLGQGDLVSLELFRSVARWRVHVVPGLEAREYSIVHVCDLVEVMLRAANRGERLPSADEQANSASTASASAVSDLQHIGWQSSENTPQLARSHAVDSQGQSEFGGSSTAMLKVRAEARMPMAVAAAGQGIYYAAAPEVYSYARLGHLIAESAGRDRIRVFRLPDSVLWTVAAANELLSKLRRRPAFMNLDKVREASSGNWTCDAGKSERQLGFAMPYSVLERLRETYNWYRDQGWL